jgi:hypothetical protein
VTFLIDRGAIELRRNTKDVKVENSSQPRSSILDDSILFSPKSTHMARRMSDASDVVLANYG